MLTVTKRYKVPFMHRVFLRDGSPAIVHAHHWTFEFEFASERLDQNGFVLDFTKLQALEESVECLRDKLVLSVFDPAIPLFRHPNMPIPLYVLPDASSEGLATHFFNKANEAVQPQAACIRCTVSEDETNFATHALLG